MTEYCSVRVTDSWEPLTDPSIVVDYVYNDGNTLNSDIVVESFSPRHGTGEPLQVTHRPGDAAEDSPNCQVTLQCKPHHSVNITGVHVASEAHMVEVYDAKDDSYLQTVRGSKDTEDSEADNSRVHFLCKCHLERPLTGVTVKFMSLGQRESFEIAHIQVQVQASLTSGGGLYRPTIDMDRLKQDVDQMGDSVSDRAKAFLTTLENFQKNKHGGVDDLRQMLVDKNCPGGMGQSMAGITALLSTFASSQNRGTDPSPLADSFPTEGAMMNHMLTQMVGQMTMGGGGGGGGEEDMYKFLQSVCGQVSQQRGTGKAPDDGDSAAQDSEQASARGSGEASSASASELESRVTAQVEATMEEKLTQVEDHIRQQVDQRLEDLESRMSSKLDAIVALLQQQQQLKETA